MTSTSTATQRAGPHTGSAWLVLSLACACQFMVILDAAIVNVALPSVQPGPRLHGHRPGLGGERLPADLRRLHAAGWPRR